MIFSPPSEIKHKHNNMEHTSKTPNIWAIDNVKLEKILRKYDEVYGWYPEHQFEAVHVWQFILSELGFTNDKMTSFKHGWKEFDADNSQTK